MVLAFYCYFATVYYSQTLCKDEGFLFFATPPMNGQWLTLISTGESVVITSINHYRMTIALMPLQVGSVAKMINCNPALGV